MACIDLKLTTLCHSWKRPPGHQQTNGWNRFYLTIVSRLLMCALRASVEVILEWHFAVPADPWWRQRRQVTWLYCVGLNRTTVHNGNINFQSFWSYNFTLDTHTHRRFQIFLKRQYAVNWMKQKAWNREYLIVSVTDDTNYLSLHEEFDRGAGLPADVIRPAMIPESKRWPPASQTSCRPPDDTSTYTEHCLWVVNKSKQAVLH